MKHISVKGLVIKEINVGESDKIIKIFTKDIGKISASAKGARKQKSHLIAGTQIFSYCDFLIYQGKNYNIIQQLEVINIFHGIREDIIKLTYASYFLELLDGVTEENQPNKELLLLTLKTLYALEKTSINPKLIARIYELRLMSLIGYMPEVIQCVSCRNKENIYRFSSKLGGVICNNCVKQDEYPHKMSKTTWYTIQYILFSDLNNLFKFTINDSTLEELEKITKNYMSYHIERKFNTLDFLKEIEDFYG
ncbi:DNA repair protein RecO [Defluviitalea phaphyphila]|uniref:DNA repair protein RecO n=1 Tax=Defluviitalea phaphyphila TaxID=1473580 RepID=UPI0007301ABE|nr:DNA repair protein RecO [Defluviitalea phaphyphila]